MLEPLKAEVLEANLDLVRQGLVIDTFGNASGISRSDGLVVIKPSGIPYHSMKPEDLVVTDMEGRVVEGSKRPSTDLPTHLVLYRSFPGIGGVVHTHSRHAAAWAQAGREILCLGTTHADYFHGPVPITEPLTADDVATDYEVNIGVLIALRFAELDPARVPGVLVHSHGPFCWGDTARAASHAAMILEEIARMALDTVAINPAATPIPQFLLDKHFLRKHGPAAYYGQIPRE
jgi:L-ribulose-5-phosphate 4-epimerase